MTIISETQQPQGLYQSVDHWIRSLDPWHADAFPSEYKFAGTTGERKSGWLGVDWVDNPIIFIPDGYDEPEERKQ